MVIENDYVSYCSDEMIFLLKSGRWKNHGLVVIQGTNKE
jgi:hypothetical protein